MRRLLLLLVVPSLGACVTNVQRRKGPERLVATRCVPGNVSASLASSPNQVRLKFDRLDSCATEYEEVWIEETDTRLALPVQVGLAVLAGAAVVTPLVGVRVALRPNPPPAPSPYSGPTFVDWVKTVGTFAAGTVAVVAMVVATNRRISGGTAEKLETSQRPAGQTEVQLLEGSFAAARIAPRPLYDGQLDLSVDEGLGLAEGRLTLDGADVQLAPAAKAQLAGLRPCQQALEALEPQTPKALSEPSIERKLTQAFECQRSGWGFADPVIATLTAFPLRPLP